MTSPVDIEEGLRLLADYDASPPGDRSVEAWDRLVDEWLFDNLPSLLAQVKEMREALAKYDADQAECPLNSKNPAIVQANKQTCTCCGNGPQGSCGVEAGASYRFVKAARQALGGGE